MRGDTEPSASIDELLQYEEDARPHPRRPPSLRGWLLRTLVVAAVLTAVIVAGLRLFGVAVSIVVVFAGIVSLLALRRVTAHVAPPPARARQHRASATHDRPAGRRDRDALSAAVQRWENLLGRAERDPTRFARTALPAIGELIDERLRQRHGITRASDPARARTLLGDPLWTSLAGPRQRAVTSGEWSILLGELEKL